MLSWRALLRVVIVALSASSLQSSLNAVCPPGGDKQSQYEVRVVQRDVMPHNAALISHTNGSSDFNFTFAAAWFPAANERDGLVVRVVECNPNHHSCEGVPHPEWTNAGALAVVNASLSTEKSPTTSHVSTSSVQWPGCDAPNVNHWWGAADPRITYRAKNKLYYLTWDNCTLNCNERSTMLSTTRNPLDPMAWTFRGPILPGVYTGGASLLFRDESNGPHYAFVSDSNTANAILLATSDGEAVGAWNNTGRQFMNGRPKCWDKDGVAAGPQPERLGSTGDYLYIYNIDTGFPYKPNPLGRCAIGWAILDGEDPTKIVARALRPLLTPTLPWEQCPTEDYRCQESMVVFSTGLKPLGNDEFFVLYGGADTDVGIAKIKVIFSRDTDATEVNLDSI